LNKKGCDAGDESDLLLLKQELRQEITQLRQEMNQGIRPGPRGDGPAAFLDDRASRVDPGGLRTDVARDLDLLRASMTVPLGSIVMVGVGVILAAIRLWA
jgi:hypothetical protein